MGDVHHLPPPGRAFFIDDDGTVLRASWHLDRSLVNLSVWHDDRCTDTFQLGVADAARLIAFLADGLSTAALDATSEAPHPTVSANVVATLRRAVARVGRR